MTTTWENKRLKFKKLDFALLAKGDKEGTENYHTAPCSLAFTSYSGEQQPIALIARGFSQPRQQPGFRSNHSTNDRILILKQLLERARKCKSSIRLLFVDYEKAFDSLGKMKCRSRRALSQNSWGIKQKLLPNHNVLIPFAYQSTTWSKQPFIA